MGPILSKETPGIDGNDDDGDKANEDDLDGVDDVDEVQAVQADEPVGDGTSFVKRDTWD